MNYARSSCRTLIGALVFLATIGIACQTGAAFAADTGLPAAEWQAIKKVIASSRFVLPVHDRPALIEAGQVVGRLQDAVPGPIVQSLPRRNWFPA